MSTNKIQNQTRIVQLHIFDDGFYYRNYFQRDDCTPLACFKIRADEGIIGSTLGQDMGGDPRKALHWA